MIKAGTTVTLDNATVRELVAALRRKAVVNCPRCMGAYGVYPCECGGTGKVEDIALMGPIRQLEAVLNHRGQ